MFPSSGNLSVSFVDSITDFCFPLQVVTVFLSHMSSVPFGTFFVIKLQVSVPNKGPVAVLQALLLDQFELCCLNCSQSSGRREEERNASSSLEPKPEIFKFTGSHSPIIIAKKFVVKTHLYSF